MDEKSSDSHPEPKYNKEKGVFKDYPDDTPKKLMKMLEKDISYGKLKKILKQDLKAIVEVKKKLFEHYLTLKNIFTHIASNSSYPTMGINDGTEFVRRSDLF